MLISNPGNDSDYRSSLQNIRHLVISYSAWRSLILVVHVHPINEVIMDVASIVHVISQPFVYSSIIIGTDISRPLTDFLSPTSHMGPWRYNCTTFPSPSRSGLSGKGRGIIFWILPEKENIWMLLDESKGG